MSINLRNKRSVSTSMASMSDLVFLLLIFFILVSTLVSPNAVDLKLPTTKNPSSTPLKNVEVYINQDVEFFINEKNRQISEDMLEDELIKELSTEENGAVLLRTDESVPVQHVVNVLDAVNSINKRTGMEHKVSLAAKAK